MPLLLAPGRGSGVQLRDEVGLASLQLTAQQLAEQPVVAVVARATVEREDEEAPTLKLLQPVRGPCGLEHGVTQRPGQAVEERRADQERGLIRGQLVEDLGPEVLAEELAVADRDRAVAVGAAHLRREGRQIEAGRPSLGLLAQLGHVELGRFDAGPRQEVVGLADIEREVGHADLQESALDAHAGEREPGVGPRRDDQTSTLGQPGGERADEVEALRVRDAVKVVDDQGDGIRRRLERGQQRRDQGRRGTVRAERREDAGGERSEPVEGDGDGGAEDDGVVIAIVAGEPGDPTGFVVDPLRQEGRLAVPGRGDDDDDGRL